MTFQLLPSEFPNTVHEAIILLFFIGAQMEFLNYILSRGFWAYVNSAWFSTLIFLFYRMLVMKRLSYFADFL
jgi:hypothetical protein